jgi:electron transfer flavoprotein alpha subunit
MANSILVIAEQRDQKLVRVSFETVAAAQQIAAHTGASIEVVVLGSDVSVAAEELATRAVAKVYALQAPELQQYTYGGYVSALSSFIEQHKPELVLLPHTYQVRDFAPRLALRLGRTLISDCIGYKYEGGKLTFTRQMFGGKFSADVSFTGEAPHIATFQNGSFRADAAQAGTASAPIETIAVTIPADAIKVHPHEAFKEAKGAVDLSQAEIIVSVGRGIKEQKNIAMAEDLAKALGGEIAASRPICDAGWLPIERQIGSSGQTVAPKLYVALGISGAIQHLVGMKGSRAILAINKDAEAPIFEIADYGVVGNLFEIVPALTAEINKAKGA